jgi:Protein of unknown function (DUF2000)
MDTEMDNVKIVVAVNKRLELGRALNAAAHAVLGLSCSDSTNESYDPRHRFRVIDYAVADAAGFLASALPLIVLRAKAGTLSRLRADLLAAGLPAIAFHEEMVGGTYVEQLKRAATRTTDDLELYAVATVGPSEILDPLTRRCSLY